ncbi:MAG: 50S ribosomal protein L6 [Candidatus Nanohaloarchaea archaeon]
MNVKTQLPEGFTASYEDGTLKVEANGEEVEKEMQHALIDVEVSGDKVEFSTGEKRRDIQSIAKTYQSHLENMIKGLEDEHVYKMKGVYAHFPMTIKKEQNEVVIENFMGERKPRRIEIEEGVEVEIDGEDLELRGSDKDAVGTTAGRIEQACSKGNRDPRTFQDGVYITSKGEKNE